MNCFQIRTKRCGIDCSHRYFVLKKHRKYGIIKAWKNIDGAVGNTNVCRVNNGLQPINKRLKEQLIVTAMKKRRLQAALAIKQAAHGRCFGRRHGRLILPCRFSVFTCFVCAFAHLCAACYRYDTFAHADTDFRVSAFLCFCGIRYPFTRMFDQRCLPRKLLFCFCRISGVPETVVPFPPDRRDR